MSPRWQRIARVVARVTAVAAGLSAASLIATSAARGGGFTVGPFLVAAIGATLAVGLWQLHWLALKAATVLLVLVGVLVPLGMLSPFRVMDEAPAVRDAPGYVVRSVAAALAISILCLGVAYLLSRLSRKRD